MTKAFMVLLSLLIVFSLPVTGAAQFTIPTNNFPPSVGSVISFSQFDTVTESFFDTVTSGSGGGQVWDFSSLTFTTVGAGLVIDPATAPHLDSFPTANAVIKVVSSANTNWAFFHTLATSLETLGTVNQNSSVENISVHHNSAPQYVFPMALNSTWQTVRDRTIVDSPNSHIVIYDTTFYHVDAYGTASCNANTIPCLRISSVQRATSNVYFFGTLASSTVSTDEMAEFAATGFNVIATVERSTFSGNPSVWYSGTALGSFVNTPTDVEETDPGALPDGFGLAQNYPNPFNPTTDIQFSVPKASDVRLVVYNMLGQQAKVLVDQNLPAGSYTADWDGTDRSGNAVASGVYLYRLETGNFSASKKMLLLK